MILLWRMIWGLTISAAVAVLPAVVLADPIGGTASRLQAAQSSLAIRLVNKLATKSPASNVLVSPASRAGSFSVIAPGGDPAFRRKIHALLGFKPTDMAWLDFEALRTVTAAASQDEPLKTANALFFSTKSGIE